ncbi:AEC family transporter [Haloarcula brevis]|uniref:AEC family transporter n=1 Tax=Haloarcula brevis TaxID=3111453 RepID=UPI00300E9A4D
MESVTSVIATSILPIFLIISSGFLLSHWQEIDSGPLNTLTLFVLNPGLIVHSITLTELGTDALFRVSLGVCLFVTAVLAASWALGKALGKQDSLLYSFLLIATFGNTGALGIPLADFAFGDLGRQTAVLFAAVHGVLVFTVGLAIASNSGAHSRLGSLKRVFRYPLVYAVLLAIAARTADVVPQADSAAMETLGLVGDSAIPVMLVILGIQLSETEYRSALSMTVTPTLFRFLLSPCLGLVIALGLGFQNATVAQVFVLLTAMPVAVAPVIFSVEFASDTSVGGVTIPEYVSATVFVSTLVSIPVLTIVVTLLQSGTVI